MARKPTAKPAAPKAGRDENGHFLPGNQHAWKKGETGNRGGMPKYLVSYIRERTNDGQELVEWLLALMKAEGEFARAPVKERIKAVQELLQRGFGRAPMMIEFDAGDGENVVRFTMDIGPAGQGVKQSEAGDDGGD